MIDTIHQLVTALRDELKEYGEMLALLDRQQSAIMTRAAEEIFQSISIIQAQSNAIQEARARREECRRFTAEQATLNGDIPFLELIPALPAEYQPLLSALVDENNSLLLRVRHRARQNHLLLHRSVELMQGVLNTLFRARPPSLYNGHGDLAGARMIAEERRPLCNAMG